METGPRSPIAVVGQGEIPSCSTVVIADDHEIVRLGLRAVVAALPDFTLVGEASTGDEAVTVAAETTPDVVVMDLHMPNLDGVTAIREILAANPSTAVLVLTMDDDDKLLMAALRAGARGYLLKGALHDEVVRALRAVASGEAVFGAGVADVVLGRMAGRVRVDEPFPQLTERERELLTLLVNGMGTGEIARSLYLAPKTVRNHIANINAKLGVPDRAQAIAAARQAGLGASPPAD